MPTFRDLRRYLERDGWTEEPGLARGRRTTGDHRRYRKELPDGTILRTKVSHALGDQIGEGLFRHILRDQLRVDEAHFRAVLRGEVPQRRTAPPPDAETVPAWLVQRLIHTVGIPEADIRGLSRDQALRIWEEFTSAPPTTSEPE